MTMCVAQISSYEDESMALFRKAQSKGLVIDVTFDEQALAEEGRYIIDSVRVTGKGFGPYPMPLISARERIGEWLYSNAH
jgi:hypothetical protein